MDQLGDFCSMRDGKILNVFERVGLIRTLHLLALCLIVSACVSRPEESKQFRDIIPMEGVQLAAAPLSAPSVQANSNPSKPMNILALSGGGAYGAYGVGVLSGWTEAGTRPEFDVVTGVSTGALMAVFAFLGPQYDKFLERLYTNVRKEDIFSDRGIEGVFSESLYDNTPLKRRIERYVTQDVLEAVAAEHARGRRLYIATTNLDAGQLVVWDMGDIANGGRSNPLQHFQKVLRASAAVPAFFQPVYIKPQRGVQLRQAHVDGGVKAPVLIPDFVFRTNRKSKSLYVIVNDSIAEKDPIEPVKPNLVSIAQKSIATLTRQLLIQSVYRGYARAQNSGSRFFLTSVPDKLGLGNTSLTFNKDQMRKLFEAGRSAALSKSPWRRRPPDALTFDVAKRSQ